MHTQLTHHYFQYASYGVSVQDSRYNTAKSKALEGAASHIKVTCPPCFFRLPPLGNVNRSTTPLTVHEWIRVVNWLFITRKITQFIRLKASYLDSVLSSISGLCTAAVEQQELHEDNTFTLNSEILQCTQWAELVSFHFFMWFIMMNIASFVR